jgi:hypothetical protein
VRPNIVKSTRQWIRNPSFWIVTGWTIFCLVALGFVWSRRERDFDSFAWKNRFDLRPCMVHDLLSDLHAGISRQEVDILLGKPCVGEGDSTQNGNYVYWAGYAGTDDMWLEIDFRDNVVAEVRYAPD